MDGTNMFMLLTVVAPSLLGSTFNFLIGDKKLSNIKPILKLTNFIILLVLNYANASTILPQAFSKPDLDYLFCILLITSLMCCVSFSAGYFISKFFKADKSDTAALMFGLGMNNNGTGLVFTTATLSDHPAVLLPIVFYTVTQQIIAATVDHLYFEDENKVITG